MLRQMTFLRSSVSPFALASLILLGFSSVVHGAKHRMFVGTYGTSAIYGLTFDDATGSMSVIKNNTTSRSENDWLALSYDGKTLYSSGSSGWSSFPIKNATELGPESSRTPTVGQCSKWGGVFILASKKAPYTVYASLSCANYITVTSTGQLAKAEQIQYIDKSVIYGMAMDPSHTYLYSSDSGNGKIWTHKVNSDGSLSNLGAVDAPSSVSAPRSIVVHPSGKAMYVVLGSWNAIAYYTINSSTHLPEFTKGLYNLVPNDVNGGDYGSQSAVTSSKGSILWATAHSKTAEKPGYLSGFKLDEAGRITQPLFQMPTATSGGRSNNIASGPFAENLVAVAESEVGSVSVYRWSNTNNTAKVVASVKIEDAKKGSSDGCCSDVVWLD